MQMLLEVYMEIKAELFEETKELEDIFSDLKALRGTIVLNTSILDGLEEEKKRELEKTISTILEWCGRSILFAVEFNKRTGDGYRLDLLIRDMVIRARSSEEELMRINLPEEHTHGQCKK